VISLRDYQAELIEKIRDAIRKGYRRILIQASTGAGKTVLMAFMADSAAKNHKRTLFNVHRRELWKQASGTFNNMGVPHGIIAPGILGNGHLIQIASAQTLVRRLDKIKPPDVVICDEAHHAVSSTFSKIIAAFPSAISIGLTASPARLDGRGLKELYDIIIPGPPMRWLIDNGFLSEYSVYAPSIGISTEGVATRGGDYATEELETKVDKPKITGSAISHYQRLAPGRMAIVFCVSIKHSMHVVEQFKAAGISAAHIDGSMAMNERDSILRCFRNGTIRVLSNVDLIGEGFDVPDASCAILLRPTKSLVVYLQAVGRVLRPSKDKAVILDHVNATMTFGLPCQEREWSLEGRKRGKRKSEEAIQPIRQCPMCYAVCKIQNTSCPECNHIFEVKRKINEIEGELQEIDKAAFAVKRKKMISEARTEDELKEVAKTLGYHPKWINHILHARMKRR